MAVAIVKSPAHPRRRPPLSPSTMAPFISQFGGRRTRSPVREAALAGWLSGGSLGRIETPKGPPCFAVRSRLRFSS